MARTISKETVTVVGGPFDGMRMLAHIKDNGTAHIQAARIFAPEGLDGYHFDQDALELVYRAREESNE